MSESDASNDAATDSAKPEGSRSPRRWNLKVLVAVIVVVAVAFWVVNSDVFGLAKSSPEPSAGATSTPATSSGKYEAKQDLCKAVDLDLYKTTVGLEAKVDTRGSTESGDTVDMACGLYSGGNDEPVRVHKLNMSVTIYETKKTAKAEFDHISEEDDDPTKPQSVAGPWEQATKYKVDDDYMDVHKFVAQDDSAMLTVSQSIDPFDAVDTEDAAKLMSTYAEQTFEYIHK